MDQRLFPPPKPYLKRKPPRYPQWECPPRDPPQPGDYRLSAPDFNIPIEPSRHSANFREFDEMLQYRVVTNDGTRQALIWLTMARNIFHKELTQMPEHYISRLVFNDNHKTVILLRDGVVYGGITFRPFDEFDFAEIAFCAVSTQQQIRGFGAHVMAHVKTYLQAVGIHNILTYADNTAVGYFKRQGFTLEINFDPSIWRRCIKDYQGATLIHCKVRSDVDYLRINDVVDQQKLLVSALLPDSEILQVTEFPVTEIKGITIDKKPQIDVKSQMKIILDKTKLHSRAWPFLKPVSKQDAPNYFEYIKTPMDLSTLEKNVNDNKYKTIEEFAKDMRLIFSNCYAYNSMESVYSRSAKELEEYFEKLMTVYKIGRKR
ncbi:acetyltransferase, GNAT family protein [Tritrichomonas foetus]|uniref:histone acetyltransferase n=1 Tax=Tritrichomonas foetus TaxID=1144522 RepID=A0A1J4KQ00_9EUKA|nr:acetyltransferase, GNAT family protein [Tritrichomonas foetus]|eukprot:OHT12976.1 acetyltransferase, GNAT family protein [Tritrichomonas foetus]